MAFGIPLLLMPNRLLLCISKFGTGCPGALQAASNTTVRHEDSHSFDGLSI